jgi:transcriptional regulator with XRE-family HTH domain
MKGPGVDQASAPRIATADRHGVPYGVRIKRARDATGKSPEQVAAQVGVSHLTYRDWEWGEGDISTTASLAEIARLSSALGLPSVVIFEDEAATGEAFSPHRLVTEIKTHLEKTGTSVDDFENRVGFEIAPALADSSKVLDWNLDCLRFVCNELGIDWRLAIP